MSHPRQRPRHRSALRPRLAIGAAAALGLAVVLVWSMLNFQTNEQTLLTIVLAGSRELATRVQRVRPLDRRLSLRCHLSALDAVHTARYVAHRLAVAGVTQPIFTEPALEAVHEGTQGTPRVINDVCDGALRLGSLGGVREIDADLVQTVLGDLRPTDTAHGTVRPLRRR